MSRKQIEDLYNNMTPEQRENWGKPKNDGYRKVYPKPEVQEKGIECGVCGMRFDYGKAYGFWCQNSNCPCQQKTTF